MSTVDSLLDRIKTHLYLNDIHPSEWFEDFDKLNTGRVSADQFRRCFEFFKFSLSDKEFENLSKQYSDKDGINYRNFIRTVDQIFTNPDLEVAPTQTVADPHQIVAKTTGKLLACLTPELEKLFAEMSHQIKTEGIHVREAFMDFDTHNCGRVTKSQFLRNLPFHNLTQSDVQMLLDRYTDPIVKDINYKRLHLDLIEYSGYKAEQTVMPDLTLPHHMNSIKLNPLPSNTADVIQRFAEYVKEDRVRILDFFMHRDSLNSGRVTTENFKNVLTLFGFQFSPEELDFLSDKYKQTIDFTDYAKYREFCLDVKKASSEEKPKAQEEKIPILTALREYIRRNRISILPPFQDFDRTGRGYVTSLQFSRVLSSMKIPISEADREFLAQKYKHESGVDYFKFVEEVDPEHKQDRRSFKPVGTDRESIENIYGHTPAGDAFVTTEEADRLIYDSKKGLLPKLNEQLQLDGILNQMKEWAYIHTVHFHDFMKDFDRLNCGEITEPQMRSAILMSGYRLSDNEFEIIANSYKSPKNKGYVQWKKFADDILSFVAPKELVTSPTMNPKAPSVTSTKQSHLPNDVERILRTINKYCVARRVSLMEQFVDKDKYKHKEVSAVSFAQVMQLIGMHVNKEEIDIICKYYINPSTNFVKYPNFVEDVRSFGGIDFGENDYTKPAVNSMPEYADKISDVVAVYPKLTVEQLQFNAILPKLQSYVLKRRIRIVDFFENFDRLRHGTVSHQKFRSVAGQIDLPISEDEIQFLIKMFTVEGTKDLFNYRLFCQKINEVFGPEDLHRKPTESGICKATFLPDPSEKVCELTHEEEEKVDEIVKRMYKKVTTRRMEVLQQFQSFDKAPHRNYITKTQFRQSVSRLGLSAEEGELSLLCRKYRCTDLDEVNYTAFVKDIGGEVKFSTEE